MVGKYPGPMASAVPTLYLNKDQIDANSPKAMNIAPAQKSFGLLIVTTVPVL
jgi:hypothetical protein